MCRGKGFAQLLMPDEPEMPGRSCGAKERSFGGGSLENEPPDPTSLLLDARCGARIGRLARPSCNGGTGALPRLGLLT